MLATGQVSRDNKLYIWDRRASHSPQVSVQVSEADGCGTCLDWSSEKPAILAVGRAGGCVSLLDIRAPAAELTGQHTKHNDMVGSIAFSTDGT